MYFLNLSGLIEHLKLDRQTEYESFQYVLAFFIWGQLPIDIFFDTPAKAAVSSFGVLVGQLVGRAIFIVIGFLVIRCFFRANGGTNGKHFLHRMLALSWVIGMRIFLFVLLPVIVLFRLMHGSSFDGFNIIYVVGFFAMCFGIIIYSYLAITGALREIAKVH